MLFCDEGITEPPLPFGVDTHLVDSGPDLQRESDRVTYNTPLLFVEHWGVPETQALQYLLELVYREVSLINIGVEVLVSAPLLH